MELSILINKFNIKGRLVSLQPFGNGNINDTFLAIYRNTFTETQVILQRVNKNVFPKPEVIMENMHNLTRHCHEKLEDPHAPLPREARGRRAEGARRPRVADAAHHQGEGFQGFCRRRQGRGLARHHAHHVGARVRRRAGARTRDGVRCRARPLSLSHQRHGPEGDQGSASRLPHHERLPQEIRPDAQVEGGEGAP